MRKALIILFVFAGLTACKKEVTDKVDQDKIFTHYQLVYNENTDVTTALATFRFSNLNGTRLMLSEPSSITVESDEMQWSEENGNYQKEFTGLKPTALFNWVDLDGNSFSNTATIRDIDFPTNLVDTLQHEDSITYFMWAGATPLDSFETTILEIDGEGETDRRVFSIDTVGATTITIDSITLSQIDSGVVNLILKKLYSPELVEGTSKGGLIVGSYQPTDKTIMLD